MSIETPTPAHDALTQWAVDNLGTIMPRLFRPKAPEYPTDEDWANLTVEGEKTFAALDAAAEAPVDVLSEQEYIERRQCYIKAYEQVRLARIALESAVYAHREGPPSLGPFVASVEWEHPFTREYTSRGITRQGGIVGYADLAVKARWGEANLRFHSRPWPDAFKWNVWMHDGWAYFEVKPRIASVGALLRQINKYRSVAESYNVRWVVVSPDATHAATLHSQGVYFVRSPAYVNGALQEQISV